ncbi:hypothetical protein [Thalassospira alkalitolerans]|jgi:hypothetical protein|uniref:hypothetical protein n=1 Tax=Thalassospira alkalitolerans TaxID=1293890 RepID=UPI0030EB2206|tara:strand:+ start:1504 stop:2190 length:687 start_codon:yes stop_codon:yes gene_type:complete
MAFRYRKRHIDSNDVMDPRDWNLNHSNYADEFNGYLDRDNFPADVITREMMQSNCCNQFFSDADDGSTSKIVPVTTSGWQYQTEAGVDFNTINAEVKADSLLVCEWSGYWLWSYDATSSTWANLPGVTLPRDPTNALCRFRLTVDGVAVAESGYSSARRARDSCYLVGATPVSAGKHQIRLSVQLIYVESNGDVNEFKELSRSASYIVGSDFGFKMRNRELVVRARYR